MVDYREQNIWQMFRVKSDALWVYLEVKIKTFNFNFPMILFNDILKFIQYHRIYK